jgi:hypothetical protein
MIRYINTLIDIQNQIEQLKKEEKPTDAALYGKLKRDLQGDLLLYSDMIDLQEKDMRKRIVLIQQKAQAMVKHQRQDTHQAFKVDGRQRFTPRQQAPHAPTAPPTNNFWNNRQPAELEGFPLWLIALWLIALWLIALWLIALWLIVVPFKLLLIRRPVVRVHCWRILANRKFHRKMVQNSVPLPTSQLNDSLSPNWIDFEFYFFLFVLAFLRVNDPSKPLINYWAWACVGSCCR